VSIPIDSTHHRQTFSAAGVVDKSIAPLGLSLHAELRYRHSSYISSQAQRVYQIQSDLLVPSLTMTCNKLSPLELAYTFELSSLWIHHPLTKLRPVLSLRESFEAGLPLGDRWLLGLQVVHSMNEVAPREYKHTLFGDLDAAWTVSKRIKLTARLANLWGQTSYRVTRLSATDISSFAVPRAHCDGYASHLRRSSLSPFSPTLPHSALRKGVLWGAFSTTEGGAFERP